MDFVITKDSFAWCKRNYPGYDVVVTTIVNTVFIDFIHPQLLKDVYSINALDACPKDNEEIGNVIRTFGNGLIASEGKEWKNKRKILNEVFNFEFLKSLTPKIAEFSEQAIDEMESTSTGKELRYNVQDYSNALASKVILTCFFGTEFRGETIEGLSVANYMKHLLGDIFVQAFSLFFALFGLKGVSLGIRKIDKDINRRIKIYQGWGRTIVDKKIQEIKEKHEKGELHEKSNDLIEAVVRNSLGNS